ncbi:MAG: hypothetical protein K0Q72_3593, partial [Armatimonadetes bacterium]|nr:hypothetical protein [Armatimonadota bacterium]
MGAKHWWIGWSLGAGALLTAAAVTAVPPAPAAGAEQLQEAALALLKNRCVRCHGPARIEGGLNLAVPTAIARGGKSGPAVSHTDPDRSLLWRRVAAGQMPPGEPLSPLDRATLRNWLAAGAPGLPTRVSARPNGDEHWASQKLRAVSPPAVRNAGRVRTPIDRFIQARLEAHGLSLAAEASPEILIRRVTFDLTGLPPTPEEVEAFVRECAVEARSARINSLLGKDAHLPALGGQGGRPRPPKPPNTAYSRLVDRLLASPAYGERWARKWLDLARYADTNGYEK